MNKAMEFLTQGLATENFWIEAFYGEFYKELAEDVAEVTGVVVEVEDGTLVIDGAAIRRVDSYGGEGQGSDFWVVLSVEKDGVVRYVKNDGWYASYDGGNFDSVGGVEVFPYKQITTSWATNESEKGSVVDSSIV